MKSKLERTAYHEAGHAVVSYWTERAITVVSIKPDKEAGTLGHVRSMKLKGVWIPDVEPERYRKRMEKMIMVNFAGMEAERLIGSRYNWVGASQDWKNATDWAMYLTEGDVDEVPLYLEWLRHKTKRLLQKPYLWHAVEALKEELLKRETIKGKDAKIIIREAIKSAPY